VATYTDDLVRVAFRGNLANGNGAGAEEFVHTLTLKLHHETGNTTDWSEIVQTVADGCRDRWAAHWSSAIATLFAGAVSYERVDAYHLDTTGHALHVGRAVFSSPPTGAANQSLPYECALAISLRATAGNDVALHPGRRRGRFYLPPLGPNTVDVDGGLTATVQGNVKTWIAGTLNDIQGMHVGPDSGPPPYTADFMRLVIASGVDGTWNQVNEVRVGRVIDSQRRRRRDQVEGYVSQAINSS
jgi:hypothetical protein